MPHGAMGTLAIVVALLALSVLASTNPEMTNALTWHAETRLPRWWSSMSAQFVHLGWVHLAVNIGALLLLAYAAHRMALSRELSFSLLAAFASVAICLTLLPPAQSWYVGFSGALHGGFAWATLQLRKYPRWLGRLGVTLFVCGLVKTSMDLTADPGLVNALGVAVAPAPHFYGYAGGSLFALFFGTGATRRGR